ncbi:hypothetical protein NPIL_269541 [Nephila pilipes]|uniref:Uncharacterized protein n=1 Tax=Nephila pilipes TaxID=299642 RepID=A0A8X6QRE4_NEPPI|nr:hypothetical protein NPIL_269541 [Nephila pilipes]
MSECFVRFTSNTDETGDRENIEYYTLLNTRKNLHPGKTTAQVQEETDSILLTFHFISYLKNPEFSSKLQNRLTLRSITEKSVTFVSPPGSILSPEPPSSLTEVKPSGFGLKPNVLRAQPTAKTDFFALSYQFGKRRMHFDTPENEWVGEEDIEKT